MGSNMAECHPVAFRWPMKAKLNGAKLVHVDPRFTRTSAVADLHVPIRAGSDIAFLGGLINYVINSKRWNSDPFFKEFVVNYTNAATIISDDFKDTEDLEGAFSGLVQFTEPPFWPYNGLLGRYDNASWQYKRGPKPAGPATKDLIAKRAGPPFDDLVRSLKPGPAEKDPTLQNPHCVFQILKRHFSRYTPEMVEQICGSPKEKFIRVAELLLENSGRDRTSAFAYAVAWTQHTYGVQMIGCCALLQLLLGNIGRPGAGVMALRGHAAIQGSTDVPTLYHSIHGYMNAPSALRPHETLRDYMAAETSPTSYYGHLPKFLVSYLKSMYGSAATAENDFGYDWHPKILGDHSHIASFAAMADGKVKGMCCVGQNPATSLNGGATRQALRQLDWLVVKDNWLTETATHWYLGPEVKNGELKDDGSTTCASWIYCGCYPAWDQNLTARREADPPGVPGAHLKWGWAWPANRRVMYNRASADLKGNPWSERKRWVWWDPTFVNPPDPKTKKPVPKGKWVGYDVPDFGATKAPDAQPKPDGIGLDALSGTQPFIMRADGRGWLFVPAGLVDGPLPTHYEPHESPIQNPLYKQQTSPVHKVWAPGKPYNKLAAVGDPKFPYVISTYRLTEHYLAGAMSRWLPWLAELQPELFIELGHDLAKEKGIKNLDWVVVSSPRGHIRAKALVTHRIGVMHIAGKPIHHVGMPWHWGWMGLSTGDVVNDLTSWVGDPNVSIHEGKAFVCNVEKA